MTEKVKGSKKVEHNNQNRTHREMEMKRRNWKRDLSISAELVEIRIEAADK